MTARRSIAAALGVTLLLVGCSTSGDDQSQLTQAAQEFVHSWPMEEYGLEAEFAVDDVEVVDVVVDGSCAAADVIEPDAAEGDGVDMTVYLRRNGDEWAGTEYVTGHLATTVGVDPDENRCRPAA